MRFHELFSQLKNHRLLWKEPYNRKKCRSLIKTNCLNFYSFYNHRNNDVSLMQNIGRVNRSKMADREKMVLAQIRYFPQYFSVFSFNKKHKKMLGKCLFCVMTIFPRSAILLRSTLIVFFLILRTNVFKQGNRSDAIGFDLAETFTRPALEYFVHVSINI
jgi:hypothetical protein